MSDQRMQYKVNMPPALYADVKAAAKANHRSLNAEIIHRLASRNPMKLEAEMTVPFDTRDQFRIRLPDGLRDEIKEAAKANGRSMNAEIVSRLQGSGKTLRDYFAGQALIGLAMLGGQEHRTPEEDATLAYRYADAMLAARQQQGGGND